MKKLSIFIAVLLVFVLLLAACSKSEKESNESSKKESNDGSTNQTESNDSEVEEPVELSIYVDMPWWPVKDWSGEIPEAITKKTGVKLDVTVATDQNQLPLMISSGDLPDLVFTGNEKISDPNVSYAWSDLIPKYVPDMKVDPLRESINTADDGKYYTLKCCYATPAEKEASPNAVDFTAGLILREDILKEMGNPQIQSLEDLENVFGMVKEQYPDMTPLSMSTGWSYKYFALQHGVVETWGFYDDNGKLSFYLRQPELKETFKYVNRLFRKGYILEENFAWASEDPVYATMLNGTSFASTWYTGGADYYEAHKKSDDMSFTQLVTLLSDKVTVVDQNTGWAGLYVTKDNENLQKTMDFIKYMSSEEGQKLTWWGIEGKHWNWHPDGYPEFTYDINDPDSDANLAVGRWNLVSNSVISALRTYDPDSSSFAAAKEIATKAKQISNPALGMVKPTEDESVIETNVRNMSDPQIVQILTAKSEAEFEDAYKEMINRAEKLGMSKMEESRTQRYQEIKDKLSQ